MHEPHSTAGAHKQPQDAGMSPCSAARTGGDPSTGGGQHPGEKEQAIPNGNTSQGVCRAPQRQTGSSPTPGSLNTETDTWAGGQEPRVVTPGDQPPEAASPFCVCV